MSSPSPTSSTRVLAAATTVTLLTKLKLLAFSPVELEPLTRLGKKIGGSLSSPSSPSTEPPGDRPSRLGRKRDRVSRIICRKAEAVLGGSYTRDPAPNAKSSPARTDAPRVSTRYDSSRPVHRPSRLHPIGRQSTPRRDSSVHAAATASRGERLKVRLTMPPACAYSAVKRTPAIPLCRAWGHRAAEQVGSKQAPPHTLQRSSWRPESKLPSQ
mmetsp:Transcript_60875/g.127603  ORF Transcript_60875/g.127603 Transcript_60875/m.127603 type:complete len:213 (+) Transcript_60875:1817-2455(+)